ncbi:Tigger transposable element-derived protein 1, partial [Stegodyphus mimosarum]
MSSITLFCVYAFSLLSPFNLSKANISVTHGMERSVGRVWIVLLNYWFENLFINIAKDYLERRNLSFKVLLIFDIPPGHGTQALTTLHPNVEVLFLPSRLSSLIQPLDPRIIKTF